MNVSMKLSCRSLEQRVSLRKLSNGIYTVKLITIKSVLAPEGTGMVISWNFTDHNEAFQKYLSLAKEQAEHIVYMSL
jgi:hypothetical protein